MRVTDFEENTPATLLFGERGLFSTNHGYPIQIPIVQLCASSELVIEPKLFGSIVAVKVLNFPDPSTVTS